MYGRSVRRCIGQLALASLDFVLSDIIMQNFQEMGNFGVAFNLVLLYMVK